MSYLKKIKTNDNAVRDFPGGIGEGANVRTPCGARRVEMVRPGDLIVTRDNGLQAVRLIWKREIQAQDIAADFDAAPICLSPRAIGPMMPQQKLYIAPDHRILVPGYKLSGQEDSKCCLVHARELAKFSDAAFVDTSTRVKEFFTFVFDTHQVFCVNGLPVESFLAGAAQIAELQDGHRKDLVRQFPDLKCKPNSYLPLGYKPVNQPEFLA